MSLPLAALLALVATLDRAPALDSEPTYLTILGQPESFADAYPPSPPEADRQLAFGIVVYTLRTAPEEIARQVSDALDTAERTGYPVLIHLDDWNYPAASSDPEVVEWSGFPAEGETYGPPVRRRWINWGSWFTVEAPPNYESPRFREDARPRFLAAANAVAERLARWRAEGRARLLAGVVVGWESGYYTMADFRPGERPTAGAETLGDDEVLGSGYAALTSRGLGPEDLEGHPLRELMTPVVHDYTAWLASLCEEAGVPRERLYTHYTGLGSQPEERVDPILREDGRNMPLSAAVNDHSRPGITATIPWADVARAAEGFRDLGRAEWGAVEIEFTHFTREEAAALSYLSGLSASGARVMCIYGWWEPAGHPFGVRGSGAEVAMRRWLAGE